MSLSRRTFFQTVGAGGAGLLTATAIVAQAREAGTGDEADVPRAEDGDLHA